MNGADSAGSFDRTAVDVIDEQRFEDYQRPQRR